MWKICHERSRLNLRKESFPNRAVNMWNFLPEHVVNAPSVDSFKNRLEPRQLTSSGAMKKLYMTTKQPHLQDANSLHRLEHKI